MNETELQDETEVHDDEGYGTAKLFEDQNDVEFVAKKVEVEPAHVINSTRATGKLTLSILSSSEMNPEQVLRALRSALNKQHQCDDGVEFGCTVIDPQWFKFHKS